MVPEGVWTLLIRGSGVKQIRCSIAIKMGSRQIGPSRIGGGRE
jgi:hypothetical protein